MLKTINIFGGGNSLNLSPNLSLISPDYGCDANTIIDLCERKFGRDYSIREYLTKIAGGKLNTQEEIWGEIEKLKLCNDTCVIFFISNIVEFRLTSIEYDKENNLTVKLTPNKFNLSSIRKESPKMYLVSFLRINTSKLEEMEAKGREYLLFSNSNIVYVMGANKALIVSEDSKEKIVQLLEGDNNERLRELVNIVYNKING